MYIVFSCAVLAYCNTRERETERERSIMKVLWFLVRLCVFLLIFLHASFGSTEERGKEYRAFFHPALAGHGSYGREPYGPIRGSPSPPIGGPTSHP
ncbi:hypothetical protein I3842_15G131700 [Carya illinoinensis]|nr:hypothetical protein I3842_15G131700 [Carya illinoinensis]